MNKNHLKNNDGFTLIELIVSIAILSFVIVGFLNLFVYGTSYVAQARQKSNISAETQSMANKSLGNETPVSGSTSITTDIVIELTQTKSITVEDVTIVTVTDSNGNQSSKIITVIP